MRELDFTLNGVTVVPDGRNLTGLSVNSSSNILKDPRPSETSLPPTTTSLPAVPIKRASEPDSTNEPPAKKPTNKRAKQSASRSKRSEAAPKGQFIMYMPFTDGRVPQAPNGPSTTPGDDADDGDSDVDDDNENENEEDEDDNETAMAKQAASPPIKLLPQEIPPFKVYTEPINPLALWTFKHRSIDLPITYTSNLPKKVLKRPSMWVGKDKGKFGEWCLIECKFSDRADRELHCRRHGCG